MNLRPTRLRGGLPVLLLAALAAVTVGCARPPAPGTTVILPKDASRPEPAAEEPAGPCKHVWLSVGWHVWDDASSGIPATGICMVTRCPKCGRVRHDCRKEPR